MVLANSSLDFSSLFLRGMRATAWLTFITIVLSLPLAVVLGVARRTAIRPVRLALNAIVELVRGIPLLVFLFWLYFGLPTVSKGTQLSPFTVATISLVLYGTCFASEIVRGVLEAIPKGQRDAAQSLHLSPWFGLRRVIMPQALPMLLPRFANMGIEILKGSALVALVGVQELNFWTKQVRAQTNDILAPYVIALVLYFAMALLISLFFRVLEAMTPAARIERHIVRQGRTADAEANR